MHRRFIHWVTAVALLLPTFSFVSSAALPEGYEQLQYVKNTLGRQIIRTGVVPNGAVPVVKLKYSLDESTEGKYVFGYWSNTQNIGTAIGRNSGKHWLRVGDKSGGGYGKMDNAVHEITLNAQDGSWVDDNCAHQDLAGVADAGKVGYFLLGRLMFKGSESFEPVKCTLYYATIWLDGKKERDFVPCRRKDDSKVGLYDKVYGEFYAGEVNGVSLEAGPIEVNPVGEGKYQISDIDGAKWQGTSEGPHPEVRDAEGTLLTEGDDYELSWSLASGNRACVLVCGKGTYEGNEESFGYEATFGEDDRWTLFKKVRYIEPVDGKGAIFKTGVVPNGRVPVVRLKYRMKEIGDNVYAFGYWNSVEESGTAVGWHLNGSKNQFWLRAGKTSGGGFGEADLKDHVVELNTPEGTKLDGEVIHQKLKDIPDGSQSEYYLMGRNNTNGDGAVVDEPCDCRIYGATIWMDGEKVREFVPVMTADGYEYGLFDEVEGRFYRNAGLGLVGVEKIVRVEYVESKGEAVIPTEVHPELARKVPTFELDFQFTALPSNAGWAFGYWTDGGSYGTSFGIYTTGGKKLFRQRVGTVAEDLENIPVDLDRHTVVINAATGSKFDNEPIQDSLLAGVEEPGDNAALNAHCYYLLGRSGNNDGVFSGRVYGFKVWLNGDLAADYRPAMRVVGQVKQPGVYDEVTKKFFKAEGILQVGPPIIPGLVILVR